MKIGVRAHDYGRHEIGEYARILSEEGYETVQLAVPKAFCGINSYSDITVTLLDEIRTEFTKRKIEISVFGCYMDLGNPKEAVRNEAVDIFKKCLSHAKILDAKMVGTETAYPHLRRQEKAEWFPYMMDSLKRITEEAEKIGMTVGIEPVAWHPLEDAETACEVLDELRSSQVKIIFDPANVLERPAEVNQPIYWRRYLDMLGEHIGAVHLKDFTVDENGRYCPCLLGHGVMDFTVLKEWLNVKPNIPVLREEINPKTARIDMQFIKNLV